MIPARLLAHVHGAKELGENLVAQGQIFFYSAKIVGRRQFIPEDERGRGGL